MDEFKEATSLETIGLIREPFSSLLSSLFVNDGSVTRVLKLARLNASGWPADSELSASKRQCCN